MGKVRESWKQQERKAPSRPAVGQTVFLSSALAAQELACSVELSEPLVSARHLSYLLVKEPSQLETKEQQVLALLLQERKLTWPIA